MAHNAGNYGEGYIPFSFTQPVVNDGGNGPLPEVPNTNSPQGDQDALAQLKALADSNPEYMETYLQLLAERENTTNAQQWYEKMSGSQYQRAVEDLKKAGLNPFLALSALGGAGSGSVSPASTWSTSPYANRVSKQNADSQRMQAATKIAGLLTTSIMAMVAMML